jgi:hypothetical protein
MTKVTITFTIDENGYHDYEDILDTFLNDLDTLGVDDTEVEEDEV